MSKEANILPREPSGPEGHRAYAVGDIHGRLDLLDELLDRIAADSSARPPARTIVVFLGDLIDRGPQSAEVVERLRTYQPGFAEPLFLLGNHEEVLLRLLGGDGALIGDWLRFGGVECLRSYGVDAEDLRHLPPDQAVAQIRAAIPTEHAQFLGSFVDTVSFGSYLFVHAGIRPGVSIPEQLQQDLRWIRRPFLEDDRDHGVVVVHGHTICDLVDVRHNRIGLDTGAYRSGVLTAVGIEAADRWFLQTGDAIGRNAGIAGTAETGPSRI